MKKLLDTIKKKDIDVILLIILIAAEAALFLKMNWWDELWNFANCYKIFEGYKIYRDLNVIITPLFFYTAQVFFKLFGATILSFKIYNIFISSTLLIIIYKIFKNLKIVKKRAITYTLLIAFLFIGLIKSGANYNIMVLIPILLYILLKIKNIENHSLTGLLLFLTFMLKQNVFIYFAIGLFVYEIIINKNIKDKIVNLIEIYSITAICIILFLIYLYLDNNLYNFINYCFLGLLEFKNENVIGNIFDLKSVFVSILSTIFMLFIINSKKIKDKLEKDTIYNIKIFLCIGIPLILIAYPIFNNYHSTLAGLVLIIGFLYTIEKTIIEELFANNKTKITKITYYTIIIVWLIICIYAICYMVIFLNSDNYYFEEKHPFYGYVVQKEDLENIEIISGYIKSKKNEGVDVKVLSCKANLYMVPLGINNGEFDLPNLGNFGIDGEDGLINQIKELKNSEILIVTEEDENIIGQESKKVREYILKNYEKTGEIQEYSIYKVVN